MKMGLCATNYKDWPTVAKYGYDFIEYAFVLLAKATDEEFEDMKAVYAKAGVPIDACMSYFPGDMVLYSFDPETGIGTDHSAVEAAVREYSEKGFARAAQLGIKIAVVGSGTARRVPQGMDRAEAQKQFARVLDVCGEVAAKYGASIVIEPLNKKETDIVNTLEEALYIHSLTTNGNVFVLNDFYHSNLEGESTEWLAKAGDHLRHVHICALDRTCPTLERDGADLLPLVKALKETGYDARVSYECGYGDSFENSIANAESLAEAIKAVWAE